MKVVLVSGAAMVQTRKDASMFAARIWDSLERFAARRMM